MEQGDCHGSVETCGLRPGLIDPGEIGAEVSGQDDFPPLYR
jgi:hypothetical protein